MTKNMTNMVTNTYESPNCDIVDIKSEGVLCASFETADDKYYGAYEW